jgi:hypothetical protein
LHSWYRLFLHFDNSFASVPTSLYYRTIQLLIMLTMSGSGSGSKEATRRCDCIMSQLIALDLIGYES